MIPTTAIVSCDANPMFRDFWPHVSRLWRKMSIEPVLVAVGFYPTPEERELGRVISVPVFPEVDLAFQTSTARYFALARQGFSCGILSDIDMLPLSRKYFIDSVREIPDNGYAHLNSAPPEGYPRIPSCYHVASGDTFDSLMQIGCDWPDFLSRVIRFAKNRELGLWGAEEAYATHCLGVNSDMPVTLLQRPPGRRIDRPTWEWTEELFRAGHYYDAHCLRPISENWDRLAPVLKLAEELL